MSMPVSRPVGLLALVAFFLLLGALPLLNATIHAQSLALFDAFYRSGALVFGGGHVVLPLLREAIVAPGWVSDDTFLAGYGAAQAVPGSLFTFAAYHGAVMNIVAERHCRRGHQPDGHFPAGHPVSDGHTAVLGNLPATRRARKRSCAASTRRWSACLAPRFTTGLDESGEDAGRFALALVGFVRMPLTSSAAHHCRTHCARRDRFGAGRAGKDQVFHADAPVAATTAAAPALPAPE